MTLFSETVRRSLEPLSSSGWSLMAVVVICSVFTPLFLGASLYIPTAEDIGTPGRLAEWMSDNAVSVTHLTPGTSAP